MRAASAQALDAVLAARSEERRCVVKLKYGIAGTPSWPRRVRAGWSARRRARDEGGRMRGRSRSRAAAGQLGANDVGVVEPAAVRDELPVPTVDLIEGDRLCDLIWEEEIGVRSLPP